MAKASVIKIDAPLTKKEEQQLLGLFESLGHKEVVIELNGKRQTLRVKQTDAEGRELFEE